ncbi:aldose 1-epimerase [Asticcacaulis sp. EMRT-3]|uniref:aldose 1-epimerase n=1 Tax=Asticcacaulis sp. EMRT-3 TaxID=3040349 RepID=UPI0024AECC5D|nr:aldose 1-epimerase [Asticcacaulis sp. EMRT-3]MDI7775710.1 aldose 1-epimerase [Asticcacaulis sp. EMRT-3]
MLRLSSGDSVLDLNPDLGGSIARFTHKGADVMRATPEDADDALQTACFPLVPFCNRIRDGRFVLEGRKVQLSPNLGDHPHALHGQGWRNGWQVIEASPSRAALSYRHAADEWPWDYESTLVYELRPKGLRMFLNVKNLSGGHMPAGLGFHPYFNLTPDTRLKASVDGVWISDEDTLPRNWHAGALYKDWTHGDRLVFDKLIDNCYTGFKGRAEVFEGERLTHTLRASPDCHWLHIFVPPGEAFFCAEPVNHMPDPFNQPNSGMKCLKAGETRMIWMDIAIA